MDSTEVTTLDLTDGFDFGNVDELIASLLVNDTISTVQIEGHIICTLTPQEGEQLFDALVKRQASGLDKLVLHTAQLAGRSIDGDRTSNNDDPSEADAFAQALDSLPKLRESRLSNLALARGFTLDRLVASLTCISTLEKVSIELEQGGTLQPQTLAEFCKGSCLQELKLWRMAISVDHLRAVAETLQTNTCLKELELGELGNEDHSMETYSEIIPAFLANNHTLESFSLMNFGGLDSAGCAAMIQALDTNDTLQVFTVRGCDNCILDIEAAHAVAHMLENNLTLQQLSMNPVGVDDRGAHAIALTLKRNNNSSLKTLILQKLVGNTQKAYESWLELARNNIVLERLFPEAAGAIKREMDFYFDLTQMRLRNLQLNVNTTGKDFLNALIHNRGYVERVFYLLSMNSSFCTMLVPEHGGSATR